MVLALLASAAVFANAADALPDDIVKNESQWMAAGVCLKRGFEYIDAVGESHMYWQCLRSKIGAPHAVDVREVLARPLQ